jgi:putative tricarboxylic transport membrane protein
MTNPSERRSRLRRLPLLALAAASAPLLAACPGDGAQTRLECIAPANPGGGWDLTCRTLAQAFREMDLAPGAVRVRNVPGAGGGVAFSNVVAQQPNHEGLLVAASPSTLLGLAQGQYGSFTEDDVRWVAAIGAETSVVAVRAAAPWATLDEFLAAWRADPASIAIGGGSAVGGQDHMKVLVLARAVGIPPRSVRYVPFDGGGEAVTALLGGFIQMFPGEGSEILGQLQAGNLRVLAVLSPEREEGPLAGVPTARELGHDVEWVVWRGFYAPPNISDEAYRGWIERLRTMAGSEQWPALLARNGLSPFFQAGPEFEALVDEQTETFRALVREIGLVR